MIHRSVVLWTLVIAFVCAVPRVWANRHPQFALLTITNQNKLYCVDRVIDQLGDASIREQFAPVKRKLYELRDAGTTTHAESIATFDPFLDEQSEEFSDAFWACWNDYAKMLAQEMYRTVDEPKASWDFQNFLFTTLLNKIPVSNEVSELWEQAKIKIPKLLKDPQANAEEIVHDLLQLGIALEGYEEEVYINYIVIEVTINWEYSKIRKSEVDFLAEEGSDEAPPTPKPAPKPAPAPAPEPTEPSPTEPTPTTPAETPSPDDETPQTPEKPKSEAVRRRTYPPPPPLTRPSTSATRPVTPSPQSPSTTTSNGDAAPPAPTRYQIRTTQSPRGEAPSISGSPSATPGPGTVGVSNTSTQSSVNAVNWPQIILVFVVTAFVCACVLWFATRRQRQRADKLTSSQSAPSTATATTTSDPVSTDHSTSYVGI